MAGGKDYRVAWQSKVSGARGVDEEDLTIEEAKKRAEALDRICPYQVHYVVKKKAPSKKTRPL